MEKISKLYSYDKEYFEDNIISTFLEIFGEPSSDYPIYIKEDFFKPNICDQIVKRLRAVKPIGSSTVSNYSYSKVDYATRNSIQLDISEQLRELYEKKFNIIKDEISDFFKVVLINNEGLQGLGYEVGGLFNWHADNASFATDEEGYFRNWKLVFKDRQISTVFFMSENVEEITKENQYSGGELVFKYLLDEKGKPLTLRPQKGTLVAFPSNPQFALCV